MARDRTHRKRKFHKKHSSRKERKINLAYRTEQNTRSCPLLSKLSPELRNHVYAFVFGGRNIHVQKHLGGSSKINYHTCLVPAKLTVTAEDYMQRHQACLEPKWPQLSSDLAFLQTCRQIHDEAALIPYSEVNYIISDGTFDSFMPRLSTERKMAITKLTVFVNNRPFREHAISVDNLKHLSNVKHLSIISIGNAGLVPFVGLEKLARLPLTTVSFTMSPRGSSGVGSTAKGLQSAASELEARLLRPWSEEEELERWYRECLGKERYDRLAQDGVSEDSDFDGSTRSAVSQMAFALYRQSLWEFLI